MPVPERRSFTLRAAIEALEDVRQIGGGNAGPRSRTAIVRPPSVNAGDARRSATPAGAYCAAFSSRCDSAAAVSRGSRRTRRSASTDTSTARPRSACSTLAARGLDDLRRRDPARVARRPRRRRSAPSRGCSGTSASADRLRCRIRSLCSRRSRSSGHDACRLLAATRIAVSGVRRSWPSEASSADFSASLWRARSAALRSSRNCARSIAIAASPAIASRVVPLDRTAGGGQQTDRPRAEPERHESHRRRRTPRFAARRLVDAAEARPTVPARSSAQRRGPASNSSQSSPDGRQIAAKSRSNRRAMKPASDAFAASLSVISRTSRLRSNRRAELVAPRHRLAGPRARDRGQIAGHQADDQQREQRDPVLRVGDRQRADRRQEEEVEGQDRGEGGRDRHPQRRRRRHQEDDDQESHRDGRGHRAIVAHGGRGDGAPRLKTA